MAPNVFKSLAEGSKKAKNLMVALADEQGTYPRSIFYDPEFAREVQKANITLKETPAEFLGAYATRLVGDVATNASRGKYWQFNHPAAIADRLLQKTIDPENALGPYGRAAIGFTALQPAFALTGAYDLTNISELGRPEGYKQNEPNPDDPTKSVAPGTELFQRFFQGRQGRPLAYEKAKEEIPSLTPQRYANYMNFLYNDPGLVGDLTLGTVKVTGENLQGVPEARILGYPINIQSSLALAGGLAGGRLGITTGRETITQPSLLQEKSAKSYYYPNKTKAVLRGAAGALAGSAAGAIAGQLVNQAIAAAGNRMQMPTQEEYKQINPDRI